MHERTARFRENWTSPKREAGPAMEPLFLRRTRPTMNVRAELWLPRPPGEIFPFFADPRNLELITPPWLRFAVVGAPPAELCVGSRIDYRLRVHGLPLRWQSEITVWQPSFRFRDEQRRGPYRRWSHTHVFVPLDGGTLCIDDVEYEVPLGGWVDRLFVREDVRQIFEYRQQALRRHLGRPEDDLAGGIRGAPWRVVVGRSDENGPGG